MGRALVIAAALPLLAYVGDHVSLVYRIPNQREQFGSVEISTLSAVPLRNNRTEYTADPPEAHQCVHSLFPQLGLTPCWFLARQRWQRVDY